MKRTVILNWAAKWTTTHEVDVPDNYAGAERAMDLLICSHIGTPPPADVAHLDGYSTIPALPFGFGWECEDRGQFWHQLPGSARPWATNGHVAIRSDSHVPTWHNAGWLHEPADVTRLRELIARLDTTPVSAPGDCQTFAAHYGAILAHPPRTLIPGPNENRWIDTGLTKVVAVLRGGEVIALVMPCRDGPIDISGRAVKP